MCGVGFMFRGVRLEVEDDGTGPHVSGCRVQVRCEPSGDHKDHAVEIFSSAVYQFG